MANSIERSIDITATPEQVWAVLTDFAAFDQWNPFIRAAAGQPVVGTRLQVTMQPAGHSPTRLQPILLEVIPNRKLRWKGSVIIPGIFDGEHTFEIATIDAQHIRFTQSEAFTGMLVPLFAGMLKDTERSFDAMNAALKVRVEAAATK